MKKVVCVETRNNKDNLLLKIEEGKLYYVDLKNY